MENLTDLYSDFKIGKLLDLFEKMKKERIPEAADFNLKAKRAELNRQTFSEIDSFVQKYAKMYEEFKAKKAVKPINDPSSMQVQEIIGNIMKEVKVFNDSEEDQRKVVDYAVQNKLLTREVADKAFLMLMGIDDE